MSFLTRSKIGAVFRIRTQFEDEDLSASLATAELCVRSSQPRGHHTSDHGQGEQSPAEPSHGPGVQGEGLNPKPRNSLGVSTSRFEVLRSRASEELAREGLAPLAPSPLLARPDPEARIRSFSKPMSLWAPESTPARQSPQEPSTIEGKSKFQILSCDELTPFSCDGLFAEIGSTPRTKSGGQWQGQPKSTRSQLSFASRQSPGPSQVETEMKGWGDSSGEEDLSWSVDDHSELSMSMDSDDLSRRSTPVLSAPRHLHSHHKALGSVRGKLSKWEEHIASSSPSNWNRKPSDSGSPVSSICSAISRLPTSSESRVSSNDSVASHMTTTFTKLRLGREGVQISCANSVSPNPYP